jgi:hypothetical protein
VSTLAGFNFPLAALKKQKQTLINQSLFTPSPSAVHVSKWLNVFLSQVSKGGGVALGAAEYPLVSRSPPFEMVNRKSTMLVL